jgi:hypothetical protein
VPADALVLARGPASEGTRATGTFTISTERGTLYTGLIPLSVMVLPVSSWIVTVGAACVVDAGDVTVQIARLYVSPTVDDASYPSHGWKSLIFRPELVHSWIIY